MGNLRQLVPQPVKNMVWKAKIFQKELTNDLKSITARVNPTPIFVLGNQKSGTTAIAQLLAEMVDFSVAIDLRKEIKNSTFHLVKQEKLSLSKFIEINKLDFSRKIIKEPNLTLFYHDLIEYFPDAKFVFVLRDPRDNIRSILNRLNIPGNLYQLEQKQQKDVTIAWKLVLDSQWLGVSGENYIEILAARWNFLTDLYLEHQDCTFLVRYEEFLKDKKGVLEQLANKLDLLPVKDITNQLDLQFQPLGKKDISWKKKNVNFIDFFGEDNLARIESICEEKILLFGYSH